jgi:hypothetical protein
MTEYHKIQSLFKRDMSKPCKPLIEGQWTRPEFEFLADNTWTFTEKVDGTNIRVIFENGVVSFGGRTDAAEIPSFLLTRLEHRFLPMPVAFAELFGSGPVVLYGEGYGARIHKGGLYRPDADFVLFDVRVGPWWLQRDDVEDVAAKLGLDVVPVIGEGTLHDAVARAKAGIRSTWGDFEAEGIVARPKIELCTRGGKRLIAKIKCRDFTT